jgi:hypothetical protein
LYTVAFFARCAAPSAKPTTVNIDREDIERRRRRPPCPDSNYRTASGAARGETDATETQPYLTFQAFRTIGVHLMWAE